MKSCLSWMLTLTILFSNGFTFANAATIDLPEEELAKESVYPKFDPPYSVKNRNVVTEKKTEFGLYYGWNFTEPIYNQNKLGVNIGYHTDEFNAYILSFTKWFAGRNTQYTDTLKKFGLNFERAPNLEYSAYLLWVLKNYYGKMSITKRGTMNLSLFPVFGLGLTKYEHKPYFGATGGLGTKFYFTKSLSLHAELRFQFQQAPNPFLGDKGGAACDEPSVNECAPRPSPSDFADKWYLSNIMDIGLSFLF